jgi:site-specific DNA-methyltransferase (adenine-specific)
MIELLHIDCMEYMASLEDNAFDLAIVDPEYGIDRGKTFGGTNWKKYEKKDWDNLPADKEYFNELFRVSKNQIIFGANYFTKHLPASMGWIIWDKGQKLTMSDAELAYSSFNRALRIFEYNRCYIGEYGGLLHPTQKPVRLYKDILINYAMEGNSILDTHGGSMSLAIACHDLGFNLTCCELDKDYYESAVERYNTHKSQMQLFNPKETFQHTQTTLNF